MVYKIRNKQFYAYMGGGMNSARVYPNKKTQLNPQLERHVTFQVHITRFTSLRLYHNYRNISRATKQFMMGDRILEQLMILQLKAYYTFPNTYEAPIGQCFFLVSKNWFKELIIETERVCCLGPQLGWHLWPTRYFVRKQPASNAT